MNRRDFFTVSSAASLAVLGARPNAALKQNRPAPPNDRAYWVDVLRRVADPVLNNLANGTLKSRMPVEQAVGAGRQTVTHLEAIGRLAAGIAPWIDLPADQTPEGQARTHYADLTRRAIGRAV